MDLSQQVLDTIQKEQIKPRPRYAIFLRRSVYWTSVVILLGIGGVAASVVIFSIANAEWDLWAKSANSGWQYFFIIFPYFWLILFGGFVALAHFNLRHTRLGYRFSLIKAIFAYCVITLATGAALYNWGFGEKLETMIAESTPYYHNLQGGRLIWDRPEQGMLGGRIIEMPEPQRFILTDQNGMRWQVTVSGTTGAEFQFVGSNIKMVGDLAGTSSFRAIEIRSWCGCGGCQKQMAPSCGQAAGSCGAGADCGCGQ